MCVLCTVLTSKGQDPQSRRFPRTPQRRVELKIAGKPQISAHWGCGPATHILRGVRFSFQHLFTGRLIDASILPLAICLLCSMLIERPIDRNLPRRTDLYHIYLPHQKARLHVTDSRPASIAAAVNKTQTCESAHTATPTKMAEKIRVEIRIVYLQTSRGGSCCG